MTGERSYENDPDDETIGKVSLGQKLRFLCIAGVGFFSDGYLNNVIGLVVPMIGYIYFKEQKSAVTTIQGDEVKGSLSLGMIGGQLVFGIFGDALGRHKVYGKELVFTLFGTLMTILLPWRGIRGNQIIAWLAVWRAFTGIGIGGDYPMSASLSTEKTSFGSRAKLVLTVFSFIGLGNFTASIVYVILISAFDGPIHRNINHLEWVWRLLLGLGTIPAALTIYARFEMKETKPYEKYVAKNTGLSQRDIPTRGLHAQFQDFRIYFSNWRHARTLFAVCGCWFLYDIAFYGLNLNQSVVLARIGFSKGSTPFQVLIRTAVGNLIVGVAGYIPGFYLGIFMPDLIGRRATQFICSALTAILYAIWAGVSSMEYASTGALMTLFTLSQFAICTGPNCTTFLIPVEVFPTRVRGTAHGIAAATGKAGAVLTAFAFGTITDKLGLDGALGLFSGIMTLCALLTLWIPETKGMSIQDIEDDAHYHRQLNGTRARLLGWGESPDHQSVGFTTPASGVSPAISGIVPMDVQDEKMII